ncbi:uncharacterized protein LOC105697387 isoform X1 [Orussus abietinus]|uniref:uncharacterized protein LOC105697387 isoform X1 n=1 Tax=Orussus abietinus TaxID=222816 RepID=UPI000625A806|nr:uncharacterized protein LOC105697387 isoform X1 [Orussus abietinus]
MADSALRRKTRSASICAPGFSSMEQMLGAMPPPGPGDSAGTPTRRRKPATRSQSARASAGSKSIRRRAAAQAAAQHQQPHHRHHEGSVRSAHCSSEPRLADADASPGLRRRGSRRGQSMHHPHQRKSNAFLDVPDAQQPSWDDAAAAAAAASGAGAGAEVEDEDSYRLRSFSLTSKGLINRGDSFRRRRSRSNSLAPADPEKEETPASPPKEVASYTVAMLGTRGVGKTALVSQFMTSEGINAYERQREVPSEQSVFVMLNGEESELRFLNVTNPKVPFSLADGAGEARAPRRLRRHVLCHRQDLLPAGRGVPGAAARPGPPPGQAGHPGGQQGGPGALEGRVLARWQMHGLHLPRQVHRDLRGHQPQRGRPAGGDPEPDPTEGGAGPRGRRDRGRGRRRGRRALVQVPGRRQGQHEGQADAHLALRQGGQQVQELREPPRPLGRAPHPRSRDDPLPSASEYFSTLRIVDVVAPRRRPRRRPSSMSLSLLPAGIVVSSCPFVQ